MQRITSFSRNIVKWNSTIFKKLKDSNLYSSMIFHLRYQDLKPAVAIPTNKYQLKVVSYSFVGLLTYLGFIKKNDYYEFTQNVKKSEIAFQIKDYKHAEQLLHEALKIAERVQSESRITDVYEKLANVAFEIEDYKTAKKLFTEVVERLLSAGTDKNDLRILYISFKLAKTLENVKKYRDAELGYQFCIQNIQPYLEEENPKYKDVQEFLLTLLTGYAYFHYNRCRFSLALDYFKQAYEVCLRTHGEEHQQTILLLNNLGTITRMKGDINNALEYFQKAEKLGEKFSDLKNLTYIYLNLGHIHLEKKMLKEAKRYCKQALKKSKRNRDKEATQESNTCLANIKKAVK